MTKITIQLFLLSIALILTQILFSKIILFNVAVPFVFIYVILRLPTNMSSNWIMTIAFLLGLSIDVFNNTQGMNALACVVLGMLRNPVLNMFQPRETELSNAVPSIDSMGVGGYAKYMSTLVVIFCALLFLIQAFTLHDILLTVSRIGASSLLSIILLLGLDTLMGTRREKRL